MKKMLKSLLKRAMDFRRKYIFLRQNNENNYHLSSKQLRWCRRKGFMPDEYVIYGLDKNDPKDYISEYERSLYREAMRDKREILDNKILFYSIIRNFADVNTIYAYKQIGDAQFVALEKGFERKAIPERLRELGKIAYKINYGGSGSGFRLLEYERGGYFINREPASLQEIEALLDADNYLLEAYCVQGRFENELFPDSVNTLRISTAENKNGDIEVMFALQRMGRVPKSCVDNANAGGILAKIDLDTGRMDVGWVYAGGSFYKEDGSEARYAIHPITGCPIEGRIIPNWNRLKEQILRLHGQLRFLGIPQIAWDVALTDDGFKIIEANLSTGVEIQLIYGGLRKHPYGRWMKERGYIR